MFTCYMDESGTPDVPGTTSHYVLAGLSIPISIWKNCDAEIRSIKRKFRLENAEIHTGWLLRSYREQEAIAGFEAMDDFQRRSAVERERKTKLLDLLRLDVKQFPRKTKAYHQEKKSYLRTNAYIHLTRKERVQFVEEIARTIGGWGVVRLFAECVDKIHFDPSKAARPVDEQALEQVVSRFETYLTITEAGSKTHTTGEYLGLLIHDNNETVAKRHTHLMKSFQTQGTLFTKIKHIIETPLFVNSELTSMVQLADVCSYSLRRYLENGEENLFSEIFKRADRKDGVVVGVRHFTNSSCPCKICSAHRPQSSGAAPGLR